jgi:predicted transcriptional regulator
MLISCIKKEFSNAYILNIVAPGMYVLTEKGQRIIEKYAEFIRKTLDTPPTD